MSRCHVRICYALLGLGLGAGLPWLFHVEPSLGGNRSNKTASGAAPTGPGDRFGQRLPAAAEKPAGNGAAAPLPVVTMAEVLAAEGGARMEKLALWLPTASSAECALMFGTVEVEQETRPSQNQYDLILRHWVGIDRDAAFRAARQTSSGEGACYHAWARLDPRAAWQEAQSRNGYAKSTVIAGIAESDPRYARELLDAAKDLADHARLSIGATIAGKLAEISPREAADYMLQHGGDPAAALAEWFSARPDEAQAWA